MQTQILQLLEITLTFLSFSANISSYEVDDDALSSLREYALANNLFWAMAEGHACEISARRNAMENASKNAGEMINKYVQSMLPPDIRFLTTLQVPDLVQPSAPGHYYR